MSILWTWTWNKNGKMSSIWEDLYKLLKKELFSSSMQIQKEKRWKIWRKRNQYGSLFSKKQKQECRKKLNGRKKKILLKIKINNFDLDMQMDTGSEVTLIPKNFLECIGKPTLRKSCFQLRQFDGSVIENFRVLWRFLGVRG